LESGDVLTLIITFGGSIYQVLHIAKIKMTQQQDIIAVQKIIALNIQECR